MTAATAKKKASGRRAATKPAATKPAATKPAAKSAAAKKPAKVPVALLRKLEGALDQTDIAHQCVGLSNQLRALTAARATAAATAVLAQTRKGSPVARAYLTAIATAGDGPLDAADVIARHCATMERGRQAMRPVFVATWRRAKDLAAVDDAYRNFARGIVDDPDLLAAGFEAARQLGNHLAAAERIAALERARRLAPLVGELTGAARERATRQLAPLPIEDRRHVYGRVLDAPSRYDQALAVAAVIASVDDPRVPDMALSAAIADMRYHGRDELLAAWRPRVAAADGALVTRLLALFEWTGLWATDAGQLEPFIHALYPAGGRPDVFAQVEGALASDRMVVREAVLGAWLREREGLGAFSDAQVDKLMRSAVAIAEAGTATNDQRAANRVLFYVGHPGARQALMDAIRNASTKKNDELRWNLYFGLSNLRHPSIVPFLIERMFVEREEYWALMEAIAARLDATTHRAVIAALSTRAGNADAAHAATVYAEVLVDKKASPRLLVELARAVLGWQPRTNDDGRRLRYVFEQATVAALTIRSPDDARAFLARGRELPDKGYSDYRVVDRDTKTPSPLAEPQVKKQLAALESGAIDKQLAEVRATADAARAAGKPIAADDARLGALAGCTVSRRLLDDRETRVVWFFDEVGALHVYDGYAVVPPPFQVVGTGSDGIAPDGMGPFIAGATIIDERVTMLDAKCTMARALIRIGDRVLVFDGNEVDTRGHIKLVVVGLKLPGYIATRDAVARFVANPPPGLKRVDPWYQEGAGVIRRGYFVPLPGGHSASAELAVLDNAIDGPADDKAPALDRRHASNEAAIKALQAWEAKVLAAGGRMTSLWVDRGTTRREDTLLYVFLNDRCHTDTEGAAWQLRGLSEMVTAIELAGLRDQVPDVQVALGPPATAAELAAYQASVTEPLPAPLVEVWREVGGGTFRCDRTTIRFLSPSEVLAQRDALRAALRGWLEARLKGKKLAAQLAMVDGVDVIATRDGGPLILFDTRQRGADGRCFCTAGSTWWESALGWEIATEINIELKRELERRVGDIYRLRLGKRVGTGVRRLRLVKADKTWEAIVDGPQLLVRTLTAKSVGKPSIKTLADAAAAAAAFDTAVAAAKAKGFT
jgi:hypothetical protein